MVEIHHVERGKEGWTNLGTRILCVDSQIHREDSRCRAIEATKKGTKWRNKFRSGPKWETRIPLLGHYCPEYSPPLPLIQQREVFFRFNFPRFASVPKNFLSFLHFYPKKEMDIFFVVRFNCTFFHIHVDLIHLLLLIFFITSITTFIIRRKIFLLNFPFFHYSIFFFFISNKTQIIDTFWLLSHR